MLGRTVVSAAANPLEERSPRVDEFWVCQHCRSLNRAGTGRCYHCREKFGSKPKEASTIVRGGGVPAPAPTPFPPGSIGNTAPAGFGAPIGGTGRTGVGAPDTSSDDDIPAYYSRPAALAPTPVRDFSAPQEKPSGEPFGLPSPTGWLRRRIARSLAVRPLVGVRTVGYASAALLALLLLDGALIATTLTPVGRVALQTASLTQAWAQMDGSHQGLLEAMGVAFLVIGALALLFFSIFIGLSTHNAPALGVSSLYLTPGGAGSAWLAMLWTQARIAIGLLVPAVLLWRGYPLPGLIAALIAVELAQRNMNDPVGWISNPARHLPDLLSRMGASGSGRSLVGGAWSICLRLANALAIVCYAIPVTAFVIVSAATLAGRTDLLVWPGSGDGPFQLAIAAVVGLLILTTVGSIGLLVPASIELVDRQRTRKTMARVGNAGSWVGWPGKASAPAQSSGPARWDPYSPSDEEPDQASLNSPSTTSSFPWGDDPSGDSPPD